MHVSIFVFLKQRQPCFMATDPPISQQAVINAFVPAIKLEFRGIEVGG